MRHVLRFEVGYALRQPIFWIASAIFFLLAFGAVTSEAVKIGGSLGSVDRNAPFVVMQFMLVMSAVGLFVTTAFVGSAVQRDFELGTHEILFSTPLRKFDYLAGRFGGAALVSWLVLWFVALAIVLGSLMPWLEPERVGPFTPAPYLFALLVLVLPNVLVSGSLFFALAAWTRSMLWTYVGVVGFFVGYAVSTSFLRDLESQTWASLLDPFGFASFELATRYWTVSEKNSLGWFLDRDLVLNRALWLALAAGVLALVYARFELAAGGTERRRRGPLEDPAGAASALPAAAAPRVAPLLGRGYGRRAFLHQARLEVLGILRGAPFLVILLFGVINVVGNSAYLDSLYGTSVYAVTHLMIDVVESAFGLTVVLVITLYAGELAWRDRERRLDGLFDALPTPTWAIWSSKLVALAVATAALLATATATAMGIQAARGYFRLEPLLYAKGVFGIQGAHFLLVACLAMAIQAVANQKYLGFLLVVLYYVSIPALQALGFEHHLYLYATTPGAPYSEMNGYGHFAAPLIWFNLYWAFWAMGLLVLAHLFWVRGRPSSLRERLAVARSRIGRGLRVALGLAACGALASGAFIFWNTNVLNRARPESARLDLQAGYERAYKDLAEVASPRIVDARADVDIYPEERSARIRGVYRLRNKTEARIDVVHLALDPDVVVRDLALEGARLDTADVRHGVRAFRLERPMSPGEERSLSFDIEARNDGFVNDPPRTKIVANGTFFDSADYFPRVGYAQDREIRDPNERRRRGLGPPRRMRDLDDPSGRGRHYLSAEADFMTFATTVSTSADQIAIAPGYLRREWTEGARRYFHYEMDAPILPFWSYLSARWEVARDRHGDVAIEVYHHPDHAWNVTRMIDATKKSLDLFEEAFGPYQHRQVRIVEFPRYARFAQSFPNTIPFSESIGFIAKLDRPEDVDYVFYVTAHEVAHQWWAHQVIGAAVQGATVLSETLSQYSALLVMEREYGPEHMRKFLKYELERYLRGRGAERIEELPLMRVEDQPYVHYNKGSVAMWALADAIGRDAVNTALARLVSDWKFAGPPYPTTRELLARLEEAAGPERRGLLADLFERITLHEIRARAATATRRPDGAWTVRIDAETRKYQADGAGRETEIPSDVWVDVAVFGKKAEGAPPEGKVLVLEKRRITGAESTLELVVSEEPVRAGLDPFHKLVDRNPDNNLVRVAVR